MKIFKKGSLFKKLILVLIVLLLFNTVLPNTISYAEDGTSIGGKLLSPVIDLIVAIGDIIMDFMHSMMLGSGEPIIRIDLDNSILEIIITAAIVIAVIAITTIALTYVATAVVPAILGKIGAAAGGVAAAAGGKAALSAAAVGTIVVTSLGTGVKAGVVAGAYAHSSWFGNEAVLTLYQITPEEIFTGELDMLRINFFSADQTTKNNNEQTKKVYSSEVNGVITIPQNGNININNATQCDNATAKALDKLKNQYGYNGSLSIDYKGSGSSFEFKGKDDINYKAKITISKPFSETGVVANNDNLRTAKIELHAEIKEAEERVPIITSLKPLIAKWYYTIRNIAIVAMMSILIYVGIRMIMTSVANEKSKYKNMLMDWIIAFCLMFVMQYIMSFSMNIVDSITDLINAYTGNEEKMVVIEDENGKIQDVLSENDLWDEAKMKDGKKISWPTRNIMGIIRTEASLSDAGTYRYIGFAIAFLVLVWYTIFFLFTYIKRIIYVAFLTIIAPLVALTYPIDKINDGKAQAFDMWLKEYIFNLLIQPFHLLLYTVLISMAYELASTNIIYTLVVLGFLMPAEKLLRKFFGFEKAQTPGFLGGAAGAALMMNGLNHVFRKPRSRDEKDYIEDGKSKDDSKAPRFSDTSGMDDKFLFDGKTSTDDRRADIKTKRGANDADVDIEPNSFGENDPTSSYNGDNDYKDIIGKLKEPNIPDEYKGSWNPNTLNDINPEDDSGAEIKDLGKNNQMQNWKDKGYEAFLKTQLPGGENSEFNIITGNKPKGQEGTEPNNPPKGQEGTGTNKSPKIHISTEERLRGGNTPKKRRKRPIRKSRWNGIKGAAQEYTSQRIDRTMKNISSGKAIKRAGQKLTGVALGTATGLLGATLGIASGDLSKVGQYGAGGAAGGYALGARSKSSKVNQDDIAEAYQKGYHGNMEEFKKAERENETKKFIENNKKIKELQEKMEYESIEKAKKKMEEYKKFVDAGFTETDDIAAMIKMVEEQGWSKEKAMTVAKFSNKLEARPSQMGPKQREDLTFKCEKIAKDQNAPNVDEAVKQIINNAELYGKTKDGINKIHIND